MAKRNNEAVVSFNADTKQFNQSMKDANKATKELKSEMKLTDAQMKASGESLDLLQTKHKNLTDQLQENEKKQEALNNKLEAAVRYFGEDSDEAQRLRIQLNSVRTEHANLETAINKCNKQISDFTGEVEEAEDATKGLTDKVKDQQDELNDLKKRYVDVSAEFGENSDEARELADRISTLSGELKDNKAKMEASQDAADKLDKSLEDTSDGAKDAGDGFTVFKGALADLASNAIQSAISAIGNFIGSLWSLAEETREFRQDMGTLETAFDNVGFSTEAATDTWRDLYAIFGEDDRAVEAANNIARMAKSEEELNKWVTITTGIWGTYQDALPVEALAESAGETAKVGKVTGNLADALNWSSEAAVMFADYMSEDVTNAEDAFNVALAECNTEAERQALITETLTTLYGGAAEQYEETTGQLMDANKANADAQIAQSELADAIEPVNTAWTEMKTELMTAVTPAITEVAGVIKDAIDWLNENEKAAKLIAIVIGAVTIALTGLAVALGIATVAQWAMNSAVLANPLTWIVVAIVAAVVALAAAIAAVIIYWDEIVAAFKAGWEWIKQAAADTGEWFKQTWQSVSSWFSELWNGIVEWWNGLWQGVSDWFNGIILTISESLSAFWQSIINSPIVVWFTELFTSIYKTLSSVIHNIIVIVKGCWQIIQHVWAIVSGWFNTTVIQPIAKFFKSMWDGISNAAKNTWSAVSGAFKAASSWFNNTVVQPVVRTFNGAWTTLKNGAQGAWNGIKSVFSSVATFFGNTFSTAWSKVKDVFSTGGKIFSGITDGITSAFKKIVNSLISGINKVVASPFNAINRALSTIRNINILGLTPFSGLGSISVPVIPQLAKGGIVDQPTLNIAGEAGAEAIAPIDELQGYIEDAVNNSYGAYNMAALVAAVEDLADRAIQLNINGREFATATASDTDRVNGGRVGLRARGLATT